MATQRAIPGANRARVRLVHRSQGPQQHRLRAGIAAGSDVTTELPGETGLGSGFGATTSGFGGDAFGTTAGRPSRTTAPALRDDAGVPACGRRDGSGEAAGLDARQRAEGARGRRPRLGGVGDPAGERAPAFREPDACHVCRQGGGSDPAVRRPHARQGARRDGARRGAIRASQPGGVRRWRVRARPRHWRAS